MEAVVFFSRQYRIYSLVIFSVGQRQRTLDVYCNLYCRENRGQNRESGRNRRTKEGNINRGLVHLQRSRVLGATGGQIGGKMARIVFFSLWFSALSNESIYTQTQQYNHIYRNREAPGLCLLRKRIFQYASFSEWIQMCHICLTSGDIIIISDHHIGKFK